ncbi:hypothetical protein ACFFYR_36230 [Paraburkholderia dipogonis]
MVKQEVNFSVRIQALKKEDVVGAGVQNTSSTLYVRLERHRLPRNTAAEVHGELRRQPTSYCSLMVIFN